MDEYNHLKIEKKWQSFWDKKKLYKAKENPKKKKFYGLIEFPYPSGDGLHVGHIKSNTAMDIICRKRRAEGFEVLYPIGWDAFGLPTENYAIKHKMHPIDVTKKNTDIFRKQLKAGGFSFDWDREINTTDPKYYKWTQWIFLKLLENNLAYKKKMPINWCPKDKTGLANEEVVDGKCERCGTPVEKKEKEQWMLAITKYADRLDKDLDDVDFLEKIKIQQRNWIGRSEGANLKFKIEGTEEFINIFTTRIDTIYSGTFIILSPEHPALLKFKSKITNWNEVSEYIEKSKKETDIERMAEGKDWTGVPLKGLSVINPATSEKMPVWIADFVLAHYGTGAVFADAHDTRDFYLAKKYGLKLKVSIKPKNVSEEELEKITKFEKCFEEEGILFNSDQFDDLTSEEARPKIISWLKGKGLAESVTNFKLRDWIFSRQHYWGEPIPVVHCEKCGMVPLSEKDLPLKLPNVKNYEPTDTGESPLSAITKWVNTKCPKCKGKARRETDTMPNWAGSSWYYLRYTDPKNSKKFADPKNLKYWTPVDWYNGGMEHTTLHLLYSRFWHKFLYDMKLVPTKEPYQKRTSHGMILAPDGEKMSKSRGNVINPDDIIKQFGADSLRVYEMFMGPFDQAIAWNPDSIVGVRRFIERVWRLTDKISAKKQVENKKLDTLIHQTVKKVTEDIEAMKFNTSISQMMICVNEMEKAAEVSKENFELFVKVLSPFAPHVTEEIWSKMGHKKSIHTEEWPKFDKAKIVEDIAKIIIQINGKMRGMIEIPMNSQNTEIEARIKDEKGINKWLEGKKIIKIIHVPNRLANIVTD
ncbi:MAG: leucine--tRNA ligase [Candidatus Taylorbacteria bacterium]|nr:leucine--tRNA ligase [Candidatus Taylorbacteria bacterium]